MGVFLYAQQPIIKEIYAGFRQQLDKEAAAKGITIEYVERNADGEAAQTTAIAGYFRSADVDAIFVVGQPAAQALKSAAQDGVDVRLLVPNATDVPLLKLLSRAGYRALLEAGVRVFEWNGSMLHAKTAVADGRWSRVGSTNLNIASWFGNCEMDVVVEDESFAQAMESMFLADLENATELVLDARRKVRAPNQPRQGYPVLTRSRGSSKRAAAGAVRIANVVGAAFTNRRVIEPVEARITVGAAVLLICLALLFGFFPRAIAYPLVLLFVWIASALLCQGWKLHRARSKAKAKGEGNAPADVAPPDT